MRTKSIKPSASQNPLRLEMLYGTTTVVTENINIKVIPETTTLQIKFINIKRGSFC